MATRAHFLFGSLVCTLLLCSSSATLAIPCGSGDVTISVDCQDGLANNDFPAPDKVNMELFFGYNDWQFLQKWDVDPLGLTTNVDVGWTVSPTVSFPSSTGTWEFNASVWDTYEDVMIVLKSGNSDGTFFSGYLLDNLLMPPQTSGTWDTGDKNVSHLTVYARGELPDDPPSGGSVAEPTTISLAMVGVLSAGYLRRRRAS